MDRRNFLRGSAAFGASTIAGCGSAPTTEVTKEVIELQYCEKATPFPSIQDPAERDIGDEIAFLKPVFPIRGVKQTKWAVDPHAHIFNASDWQIVGGLRGPIARTMPSGELRELMVSLAPVVEKLLLEDVISPGEEMDKLNEWASAVDIVEARQNAYKSAKDYEYELSKSLFYALEGTYFSKIVNLGLTQEPRLFTGKEHKRFSHEFVIHAIEFSRGSIPSPMPDAQRLIDQNFNQESRNTRRAQNAIEVLSRTGAIPLGSLDSLPDLSRVSGLIGFLYQVICPRFMNLLAYQTAFSTSVDSFGISQCYASLLDFDYWIRGCEHPRSLLQDQVKLMARISQLSGGYMQPMIAYNPWADIENDNASYNLVREAIEDYGFVGVKIYPQLGYYPSGNSTRENYPTDGVPEHPDLRLLDEKLRHFFSLCREKDVPVMAHSNESMGRTPSHNKLGGPDAWGTFFEDAANRGVRINLAHMGGHDGGSKAGPATGDWTRAFTEVMRSENATHLYGDFGRWMELVMGDERTTEKTRDRIVELLTVEVSNGQTVADRFMFGTDWLMLTIDHPWKSYPEKFQNALLAAGVDNEVLNKIFYKNADALFNVSGRE